MGAADVPPAGRGTSASPAGQMRHPSPLLVPGEILVEIMADTQSAGFRAPQALTGPFPSGAPAIFAAQAARLGAPVAMISAVGRDDFGTLNLDRLRADGVDVSAVSVTSRPTGSAFVRYRPDGGRDFVFNLRHAACGHLRPGAAAQRAIAAAGHLHVMGSSLSIPWVRRLVLQAAPQIRARGGTLSFDPNLRREMLDSLGMWEAMQAVLGLTDVFLPSGDELGLLTGTAIGDAAAAVAALQARGVGLVVHKLGAMGARAYGPGGAVFCPAFAVTEVDPTGAGDCFGAAFVTSWRAGLPLPEALRRACAAGALAVTRRGPMEGAARPSELDALLG